MANNPTRAQLERWQKIRLLGCIICENMDVEIHHCETGRGGRKNHDKVIPLCYYHHRGPQGIDGRTSGYPISKKRWQETYGTEQELMEKVEKLLRMP